MAYPIMTSTLPTVVGMGVVSRTTETMFGKGGRVNRRKFNNKVYKPANWHITKAMAERDASYFRKAGHSARVTKKYNPYIKRWGYAVYVR